MAVVDITDEQEPESTKTIPAHVDHPRVKFNPLYWIKETDTVEVIIRLNGNDQKHWSYIPNPATYPTVESGQGLLFDCKLAIVQSSRVIPE